MMKALSPSTGVVTKAALAELEIAARHADETDVVHREEDRVGADEGDPEVEPAHGLVEHPAGDLRVPVVDGAEDDQDRRHPHHHVEVRDDEHGVAERHVDDDVAEEEPGQPAVEEGDDEGEREQHRDGQVDVAAPERQHPVVDLDRRRHRDDQRRRGEEEAEVGVHPRDVHVVRPDDEAQRADDRRSPRPSCGSRRCSCARASRSGRRRCRRPAARRCRPPGARRTRRGAGRGSGCRRRRRAARPSRPAPA